MDDHVPPRDPDGTHISAQAGKAVPEAGLEDRPQLDPDFLHATPATSQSGDHQREGVLLPAAEHSPGARLEESRNRMRRVAFLTDVAEKMLEQSRSEQADAARLVERLLLMEERRHEEMLRVVLAEATRDRRVFQESVQRTVTAMVSFVDQLKRLGDLLQARPRSPGGLPPCPHRPPDPSPCPRAGASARRAAGRTTAPCHSYSLRAARRENAENRPPFSPSRASAAGPRGQLPGRGNRRRRGGRKRALLES